MKRLLPSLAFLLMAVTSPGAFAGGLNWEDLRSRVESAPVMGGARALDQNSGGPVIVTFFASWCPPCTDEFRHLNALSASGEFNDVQIVGINVFEDFGGVEDPGRMERFIERTEPDFALVKGSKAIRAAFGGIDRIPTVIVYGHAGEEVWRFVHERNAEKTHATEADLRQALKRLQNQ
ncbi:TlpA family protein disulfide reductase [Hoeflea prorocentri]|uniref:TlpA disulfide reductase family protein n=1 Tax=Hoeflea prorocentri TaxID=1922333 RepID=A0A9X3UF98_9HYPH|nr:TlpA disulfide reductase family protein [Hoeflea prorocentri]MCY6379475.1 TlpA disulfide reductase family protein [Hoeflea prorocentri]MDA5397275.1 TlpA disulfide reductase family protein [Hoeflea prorocentri]